MRISDWSSDVCSSDLLNRHDVLLDIAFGAVKEARNGVDPVERLVRRRAAKLFRQHAVIPTMIDRIKIQIGRASCRERVCQYVSISVVAGSLKKKNNKANNTTTLNRKTQNQ